MRISEIYIDGYGQFAAKNFGPLQQSVTIFYGPNEAGKSTLLEFIRTVLFGFRRAPGDYPPLAGGRHGGRVTLINKDGLRTDVSRFKGGPSAGVTLTSETGAPLDETMLAQILGNNSRALFEQVFAFTLTELHSTALLEDANVNSQIYSAGMGVTSLPSVMKSIGDGREKLFRKRGSSQKIYDAHKKLRGIEEKLREIEVNAGRYGDLITRQQQVETELESLAACRREIRSRLDHQKRLQSAWDPWNDLVSTQQEIVSLPPMDNFPVDGISRLDKLEERVRNTRREYEYAEARVEEAEREAEIQVEHETILQHEPDIRRLQEGRKDFIGLFKDLPERQAELRERERTLAKTLRDLGPDWNETRLEAFDFSMVVHQEIDDHRDGLRAVSEALSSHRSSHNQNEIALKEAIEAEEQANSKFQSSVEPSLDAEQIRSRRNLIRKIKSGVDELERKRQNVSNLQNQLAGLQSTDLPLGGADRNRTVAIVSLAVGIALLAGGAILGGNALYVGVVAGIALGVLAGYLFMTGKSGLAVAGESPLASSIRKSIRNDDADIQTRQSKMLREAEPLGLEEVDVPSIFAAEDSIDEEERSLQEWTRLSQALDKAKELTAQRQTRVEESAAAVEDAERQLVSAQHDWQHWLNSRGLLDSFTPETAGELQRQVELGRSQLGELRSFRQRIKDIENDIARHVEDVEPLASTFDVTFDRNDERAVVAAADRLVELLEEVRESDRRRTSAQSEMEAAKRQLEEREGELQEAQGELEQLFRSGGAEDAEEFRVRAKQTELRAELETKSQTAHDQLQRLSGPGEPLQSLKADLQRTNLQSIANEIAALEEEQASVGAQHDELLTKRGSIQAELDNLEGEEESSRLRMQRNILLEQLRGHAHEWSRLTLAHNLLREARGKFERERQPDRSFVTPRRFSQRSPRDGTPRCTLLSVNRRSR